MLYGFMWLTVLVLGAPAVYLVNNHLFVNVPAYRRGVFAWIGTKGGAFRIPKVGETTELHTEDGRKYELRGPNDEVVVPV
jgi:hypothetical protein